MRARPLACALILSLTPALLPPVALAQPAADQATTAMARARFKEGVQYYDKGQYEAARASFIQAYALKKHPAVLINLAWSCLKAGHPLEAERYFSQFLRDAPNAKPSEKVDAEKGLAEARAQLGRIQINAPPGTEVTIDQTTVGHAPLDPISVEPGTHVVKFRGEGVNGSETVTASAGQIVTASITASPSASPAEPSSAPDAHAVTPANHPPPVAGETPASRVNADTSTSMWSRPKSMAPVYIGAGLSLASFGLAAVMLIAKQSAQEKADDIERQIQQQPGARPGICSSTDPAEVARFGNACRALEENNDAVDKDALVGNIALAVGGAALVGTLVYYFVAPKKGATTTALDPSPSRPALVPIVGPRTGGLSLQGQF